MGHYSPTLVKLAFVVVIVVVAADAAITCGKVIGGVAPCLGYVRGTGSSGKPSSSCCNGIKGLNSAAKTKADRQAVCNCLKQSAGNIQFDPNRVKGLPKACGVNVGFPISTSTDCNKVT